MLMPRHPSLTLDRQIQQITPDGDLTIPFEQH